MKIYVRQTFTEVIKLPSSLKIPLNFETKITLSSH